MFFFWFFVVQKVFKTDPDLRVRIHLSDNHSTPINLRNFETVVRHHCRSGSFYINVQYKIMQQNCDIITSQVLFVSIQ